MKSIGSVFVLAHAPGERKGLGPFRLAEHALIARSSLDSASWDELKPYGSRSAKLVAAAARLAQAKFVQVRVRRVLPSAPQPEPTDASSLLPTLLGTAAELSAAPITPHEATTTGASNVTLEADVQVLLASGNAPTSPSAALHPGGSQPGVPGTPSSSPLLLLALDLHVPLAICHSYNEITLARYWQKHRQAAVTLLGAIVAPDVVGAEWDDDPGNDPGLHSGAGPSTSHPEGSAPSDHDGLAPTSALPLAPPSTPPTAPALDPAGPSQQQPAPEATAPDPLATQQLAPVLEPGCDDPAAAAAVSAEAARAAAGILADSWVQSWPWLREAVEELLEPEGADRERYSLISCFRELPSVTQRRGADVAGPPRPPRVPTPPTAAQDHHHHHHQQALTPPLTDPQQYQQQQQGPQQSPLQSPPSPRCGLLELPHELLVAVVSHLEPLDLARLRATCWGLAEEAGRGDAVPGVALVLFPHQRAAVSWMLNRERSRPAGHTRHQAQAQGPRHSRNPQFVELVRGMYDEEGEYVGYGLWADVGTGELRAMPPPPGLDVRGGFFCDEPGLGKTITALSLVLKTLGQLPGAPPGAAVSWTRSREGRRVGLYTTAATQPPGSAGAGFNGGNIGGGAAPAAAHAVPSTSPNRRSPRGAAATSVASGGAAAGLQACMTANSGRRTTRSVTATTAAAHLTLGSVPVTTMEPAVGLGARAGASALNPSHATLTPTNSFPGPRGTEASQRVVATAPARPGAALCMSGSALAPAPACCSASSAPRGTTSAAAVGAEGGGAQQGGPPGAAPGPAALKPDPAMPPTHTALKQEVQQLQRQQPGLVLKEEARRCGPLPQQSPPPQQRQPAARKRVRFADDDDAGGGGGGGLASDGPARATASASPAPASSRTPTIGPDPAGSQAVPNDCRGAMGSGPAGRGACGAPAGVRFAQGADERPRRRPRSFARLRLAHSPPPPEVCEGASERASALGMGDAKRRKAGGSAAAASAGGGRGIAAEEGRGAGGEEGRGSGGEAAAAQEAPAAGCAGAAAARSAAAAAPGVAAAGVTGRRQPAKRPRCAPLSRGVEGAAAGASKRGRMMACGAEEGEEEGQEEGQEEGEEEGLEEGQEDAAASKGAQERGPGGGSPAPQRGGRGRGRGQGRGRGAAGRGSSRSRRRASSFSSSDESGEGSLRDDSSGSSDEEGGGRGKKGRNAARGQLGSGARGGAARGRALGRGQAKRGGGGRGSDGRVGPQGGGRGGSKAAARSRAGSEEGEAEEAGGGEEQALYVQCERCQAWRRMPAGVRAPGTDPWFCHLHPVPEVARCSAPREDLGEEGGVFEEAPGYLRPGEEGGRDGNVAFMVAALRRLAAGQQSGQSFVPALRWLVQLAPDSLIARGPGVAVPTEIWRGSPGYETAFGALDLVPVVDDPSSRYHPHQGGGGGRRGSPGRGRGRGRSRGRGPQPRGRHVWRLAPYMGTLRLDLTALSLALAFVTSPHGQTQSGPPLTYLSGATLVVLPPTIIDHWLLQIRKHVAPGTLRVCVLDRQNPRDPPSPEKLAWEYDIIITTFNCLSAAKAADGSREGLASLARPVMEVHWLRVILDEGHLLASTAITNKLQMACRLRAERRWVMTGTPTPATGTGSGAAHLQPLLAFLRYEPYGTNSTAWQDVVQRPLEGCRPEGRRRLMALLRETMIRASKSDLVLLPRLVKRRIVLQFEPHHAVSYNELVEVVRRNLLTSDWCDEDHKQSLLSTRNSRWARQMMNNVWLSCCVAGSMNTVVKEEDLLETLQLLAGRLALPPPTDAGQLAGPPWLHPGHPLWEVELGLRGGTRCQLCREASKQPMVTPCGHLACLDCTATDRERCPLPACRKPYTMQAVDDPARFKDNAKPKWPVPKELIEWQPVYHQEGAQGIDGGRWSASWQTTDSSKISYMVRRLREVGAVPCRPSQPPPPPQPAQTRAQPLTLTLTSAVEPSPQPFPPASPEDISGGAAAAAAATAPLARPGSDPMTVPGCASASASAVASAATAAGSDGCSGLRDKGGGADGAAKGLGAGSGAGPGNSVMQDGAERWDDGGTGVRFGGGGGGLAAAYRRTPVRAKAIVFTQYGLHLQLIERSLMQAEIPFQLFVQAVDRAARDEALAIFRNDPHCGVLVMDQAGAVGLDLSFVSYVLLMEPIVDSSLEKQVLSRAHRMGAERDVLVETLFMGGSVEEELIRMRSSGAAAAEQRPGWGQQQQQHQPAGVGLGSTAPRAAYDGSRQGGPCARRGEEAVEVEEAEDGGIQGDRRELRNRLYLLLRKVPLGTDASVAGKEAAARRRHGRYHGLGGQAEGLPRSDLGSGAAAGSGGGDGAGAAEQPPNKPGDSGAGGSGSKGNISSDGGGAAGGGGEGASDPDSSTAAVAGPPGSAVGGSDGSGSGAPGPSAALFPLPSAPRMALGAAVATSSAPAPSPMASEA